MARLNTLDELVEMVLDNCRLSTNASRGVEHRNYVKRLIRDYYETLYSEHDWPFIRIKKENAGKDIAAGQRYYDFPATLDLERAYELWVKWGTGWIPLAYGIGPAEYSAYDSDADARSDPPIRWQIYQEGQFEIWPLPASNTTNGLRFEGYKKMTLLSAGSDRCDLDGILVAKFVAAEILAGNKAADAPAKLASAQERLATLKAHAPRPRVIMGGNSTGQASTYRIIGGRFARVNG